MGGIFGEKEGDKTAGYSRNVCSNIQFYYNATAIAHTMLLILKKEPRKLRIELDVGSKRCVTFSRLQISFSICLLILSHHMTCSHPLFHHMTLSPDRLPIILTMWFPFGCACDSHWLQSSSMYPRTHTWVSSTQNDSILCTMTLY